MSKNFTKFEYNLTHCFLEVARTGAASTKDSDPKVQTIIDKVGPNPLANIVFGPVSVTIVYSFLAIESFVNYHLYHVWKTRNSDSEQSRRFIDEFGKFDNFEGIRTTKSGRDLPSKLKALCRIAGFAMPHEVLPDLWQDFLFLSKSSRHFMIHPYPDPDFFGTHVSRIMMETKTGKYIEIAEALIGHIYDQARWERPDWLSRSTLFKFSSVDVLYDPEQEKS